MDARYPATSTEAVLVRISFRIGADAPLWRDVAPWLGEARDHYRAVPQNGIHPDDLPQFDEEERCDLLVFEDFGTAGLRGDSGAAFPDEDPDEEQRNHFFHFWRAEGRSEKKTDELGSKGLGKDVYYRSSRINTAFGLTIRAGSQSGKGLLMGQTLLKLHTIATDADGSRYQEGYWGAADLGSTGVVLPVENASETERFRTAFGLWRGGEPGLSMVVPYLDDEINRKEVIRAIVRNYFYAILAGKLEVVVRLPGEQDEHAMESQSLQGVAEALEKAGQVTPADTAVINLAAWAVREIRADERHQLRAPADPNRLSKWQDQELDSFLKALRETLAGRGRIAVRIPVCVRHRKNGGAVSHFDVYLQPANDNELHGPTFVRDGIVIPDVRARKVRGIHSLVVVESGPLAKFLRQSENPSHTIWQKEEVRKDYLNAAGTLDFVTTGVRSIMDRLVASDQARDDTLLADLFPMPDPVQPTPTIPVDPDSPPPEPPQPNPPEILIKKRLGGFRLEPGPGFKPGKQCWIVSAAYDVRRGNPLTRYQPSDFQFDQTSMTLTSAGAAHIGVAPDGHQDRLVVEDPAAGTFWLEVNGFDRNRQLLVRVEKRASSA